MDDNLVGVYDAFYPGLKKNLSQQWFCANPVQDSTLGKSFILHVNEATQHHRILLFRHQNYCIPWLSYQPPPKVQPNKLMLAIYCIL